MVPNTQTSLSCTKATYIKVGAGFSHSQIVTVARAIHNFNFRSTRSEIFIPET